MTKKYFELLDFPKFAYPSIDAIDPIQTAQNLIDRLNGAGFMSYGQIWSRMPLIAGGFADDAFIEREFSSYSDEWKNAAIQHVVRELRAYFGGRGRWYPASPKPLRIAGFWFKPSIKGIWFVEGVAYAVSINARKHQQLFPEHVNFIARGIYELHCAEDPNNPIPLVIDVSEWSKAEGRQLRAHVVKPEDSTSVEVFNEAVKGFLESLKIAGVPLPSLELDDVLGLFRPR